MTDVPRGHVVVVGRWVEPETSDVDPARGDGSKDGVVYDAFGATS